MGNGFPETFGYDQRGRETAISVGTASYYVNPTPSTGWVEVEGSEQCEYLSPQGAKVKTGAAADSVIPQSRLTCDTGDVWAQVGQPAGDARHSSTSASDGLASAMAPGLGSSDVGVTVNGSELDLTSTAAGSGTNYSLDCGSESDDPADFTPPSFEVYCSGNGAA